MRGAAGPASSRMSQALHPGYGCCSARHNETQEPAQNRRATRLRERVDAEHHLSRAKARPIHAAGSERLPRLSKVIKTAMRERPLGDVDDDALGRPIDSLDDDLARRG